MFFHSKPFSVGDDISGAQKLQGYPSLVQGAGLRSAGLHGETLLRRHTSVQIAPPALINTTN